MSRLEDLEKWAHELAEKNPREFLRRFERTLKFYEDEAAKDFAETRIRAVHWIVSHGGDPEKQSPDMLARFAMDELNRYIDLQDAARASAPCAGGQPVQSVATVATPQPEETGR